METKNSKRVCDIEKRIDQVINDLSSLNEELFRTSFFDLKDLPEGYLSTQEAIEKSHAFLCLTVQAMKVQAFLLDKELLENGELNEAKEDLFSAAFKDF